MARITQAPSSGRPGRLGTDQPRRPRLLPRRRTLPRADSGNPRQPGAKRRARRPQRLHPGPDLARTDRRHPRHPRSRARSQPSAVEQASSSRAGNGTSLLVAQAQQNLLTAQLSEVQAVTNHLIALVEVYRLEGSLLYRRGLDAPGGATPCRRPSPGIKPEPYSERGLQ